MDKDKILNVTTIIQLAAASITLGAAIYLARFKYNLINELDKRYVSKVENNLMEQFALREHARLDQEDGEIWQEIQRMRREGK